MELRKFIATTIREYLNEQEMLNDGFWKKSHEQEIFKQTNNTWTHATYSEKLINNLKNGDDFIGEKEDLTNFNILNKGKFATYVNQYSPNFKKGSIFSGFEKHPFLITTELPNNAFQPNWNSKNYDNFNDSQNVGVLKPEYRKSENFKLWKLNNIGEFELI